MPKTSPPFVQISAGERRSIVTALIGACGAELAAAAAAGREPAPPLPLPLRSAAAVEQAAASGAVVGCGVSPPDVGAAAAQPWRRRPPSRGHGDPPRASAGAVGNDSSPPVVPGGAAHAAHSEVLRLALQALGQMAGDVFPGRPGTASAR